MYDLKGFRQAFGLTQKNIADIFNCGQANVSSMEKSMRDLEPEQYKKLCERFDVASVDKFKVTDFIYDSKKKECASNNNGYITYLLPMSAMGGSLTGFAEPGVLLQNCEAVVSPIENVDFAITVYGDSMAPEYPSGSRILIKKINPDLFIDWGKVYVLDTPNGVIVKEVHESNREGYVSCYSINPDPKFKSFDVLMSEIFGMYRVLMCLSAK